MGLFLPATCASAKILLGSQTCERQRVRCGEPLSPQTNPSTEWGLFETKYGGTVFTCPSVKNLHNPRQVSANYLRIPSFAIMAR